MKPLHQYNENNALIEKMRIDCQNCCGLCCVALYYSKTDGFPSDKSAGTPCDKLSNDFKCSIHTKLHECGLKGCMAFDCLGAGQVVSRDIYAGANWKTTSNISSEMFEVFLVVWKLRQMLWYLAECLSLPQSENYKAEINSLILENENMTALPPKEILKIDMDLYKTKVNKILKKISSLISKELKSESDNKIIDYIGKNLKNSNLVGKDFTMTLLIATNLDGCNLYGANFLGADMRDTNIKNADLSESVFLTQAQINSAKGNKNTKLPKPLNHPVSW